LRDTVQDDLFHALDQVDVGIVGLSRVRLKQGNIEARRSDSVARKWTTRCEGIRRCLIPLIAPWLTFEAPGSPSLAERSTLMVDMGNAGAAAITS